MMHNQFKTEKLKHLMLAMGPRDLNSAPYSPVHCSNHSMTSFQSSELTELPVVENSACTAHGTPPNTPPPPQCLGGVGGGEFVPHTIAVTTAATTASWSAQRGGTNWLHLPCIRFPKRRGSTQRYGTLHPGPRQAVLSVSFT